MSKDVKSVERSPKIPQRNDPQHVNDRTFFINASNQSLTAIPLEIFAFTELEEVHLENNQIEEIPQEVQLLYLDRNNLRSPCPALGLPSSLESLESLGLSCNRISSSSLLVVSFLRALREPRPYPTDLKEVPVLLGLAGNHLKCLPEEIVNQTKLREIYLKRNQFEVFPQQLCVLCNLEIIDLDENKIGAVPEEIGHLTRLQKFFAASDNLPVLPASLCQCSRLSVLDLSHDLLHSVPNSLAELREMSGNRPEKVPRLICRWTSLHLLCLRNTGLRGLRGSFRRLLNLRCLDLSQNRLDHCPPQICSLKNLEVLALDDNKTGQLPSELGSLSKLKILGLTGNEFLSFPEEVLSLESLEKLYVGQDQGSKLTYVPEHIGKLQSLKELYIENNHLEYLPMSLGSMPNLELKQLPDAICQAQALKELLLEDNLLTHLPENLDSLVNIKVLTLMDNPMEEPPKEVCAEGNEAIWKYLKEKRKKNIMATKIQAWWCGTMVRKGFGKFSELIKARKKGKASPKDKKGKKDVKEIPGKENQK
uniref:Leucine rich repeats and IQ motif containing 4 n=1 Tax=Aotus nancymaae TaxID=37293 RepID=A0A2K5E7F6_AOTNA